MTQKVSRSVHCVVSYAICQERRAVEFWYFAFNSSRICVLSVNRFDCHIQSMDGVAYEPQFGDVCFFSTHNNTDAAFVE